MSSQFENVANFLDVPVDDLADLTNEQRAYLIESWIQVTDPDTGKTVPLIANAMQREIAASITDYEITVKWRRGGLTTWYVADAWIDVLTKPNVSVELFAHNDKTAKDIFEQIVVRQYESLPDEIRPIADRSTVNSLYFKDMGSKFIVRTIGQSQATAESAGQGRTINVLICTEFAFWRYAEAGFDKLMNCVPIHGGKVRIDSTPNGQNSFFSRFGQARVGKSRYRARFFPWWYSNKCALPLEEGEQLDNLHNGGEITAEEDRLGAGNPLWDERRGKDKLTPEQIKWRRWKIDDIEPLGALTARDRFRVEFPEDANSCFLHTGREFFRSKDLVVKCEPLKKALDEFKTDAEGNLVLDANGKPIKTGYKHEHVIGLDTSTGDANGHPAGISIVDISQEPAVQVYEWIGWEPTDVQAEMVVALQERFPGIIIVERNTPGDSVLMLLKRWGIGGVYKHRDPEMREHMQKQAKSKPGFPMSGVTKPRIFTELQLALKNDELLLCGDQTVLDLKGMKYGENDKIEYQGVPEVGDRGIVTHGELAIATAMSWWGRKRMGAGVA
jgi:hypothetical protein